MDTKGPMFKGGFHLSWVPQGQSTCAAAQWQWMPSPFPCLYVSLYEPSPTFTLHNSMSTNNGKMKEVPTFAVLRQFRVAEQVTCHNSGKSLWLDLQANSWHRMVEWQWRRLTLCRQPQQNHSSAWMCAHVFSLTLVSHKSLLYPSYLRLLSHIRFTLNPPPRRAVASGNK